jgi:hypothetical protein
MPLKSYFLDINTQIVFLVICIIYWIAIFIELSFLYTDNLYFFSLKVNRSQNEILQFIQLERRFEWLNYLIAPVYSLLISLFTAFCLNIGVLLKNYQVRFKNLYNLAVKANLIFALSYLMITILKITVIPHDLDNIENNDFQSVIAFLNYNQIPKWAYFALQLVNFTQISYIIFLSIGVAFYLKANFIKSLTLTVGSYGLGLLIWAIFITFIGFNLIYH